MRLAQFALVGMGALVAFVITQTPALASTVTPVGAPEIDGASVSAGLGLVAAGVMLLRARGGR